MKKEIKDIPVLPLRGVTIFPEMVMHFDVGREKSLKAIEEAMKQNEMILAVSQRDADVDEPKREDLYEIGTLVEIKQTVKVGEDQLKVLVKGTARAKILTLQDETYMSADVEVIKDKLIEADKEEQALIRTIAELFEKYASINPRITDEVLYGILGLKNSIEMMDIIIGHIVLEVEKKQAILECLDIKKRMFKIITILEAEIEILTLQKEIFNKVKQNIDQSQKEYFLREQVKIIQEQLGDKDGIQGDIDKYNEQLKNTPEFVKEKIEKEIRRLKNTPASSPDNGNIRTYIETVLDIPWNHYTKENIQLKKAAEILDKEHYGLEKVKERVLEYLAVRSLSEESPAPILCLVGPPGVGKTSIAKSIAHATGRNDVRISLGGVRDEAEIRGHRRTYVGAIPGRFVYGISEAKSMNPLILLDEIDKMASDFKGDPAAALLEILDSKQNNSFKDHYLELPLDLSKVLFVATANSLSTVPKPLLDRMEIIEVGSYTSLEKLEIAMKYLLPNQLKAHHLDKKQIKFSRTNILYLIEHYTKEAGVRGLERMLAKVCRKAAREIVEQDIASIQITPKKLGEYLGSSSFDYELKNKEPEVGIVRGLAWTSVGGDTLSIEVNCMPGKGQLELTGQMGNVMKESAKAAMSYIRSKVNELGIAEDFYVKNDLHIHIPEGAVPKDGPSAGITMATAMISALTNKPVKADLAMTGEITIRGRVVPIGGLKEKLLAAKRAKIKHVIVPDQNKKNVEELENHIVEGLKISFVHTMDEVLQYVFA
ncbi:endopeptidase La [Cellulosilyticum sp. WCF-2]|uniref:endopeptidase La n=1 Tax=Cellulosilyticum sp. WCF-2 TaxID=2497860 RepID=UPI000F8CFFF1|nr:endopeptidase La [Cellulosilyticum sp. WCF-2]QEH68397.1 endopeptidase La [Cellulosilyticum sp. WCF-2]